MNYLIYSVEDDKNISHLINVALSKQGYVVESFYDGESFLRRFNEQKPNLILLDMMLPNIQGGEILKVIRDNEENDDTRNNVGKCLIQTKVGCDLTRTLLHEYKNERSQNHEKRVKLCKPRNHNSGKSSAADCIGSNRVVGACNKQKARNTAKCTRNNHGSDDYIFNIDTDITRGILAFTDNGNFISVL